MNVSDLDVYLAGLRGNLGEARGGTADTTSARELQLFIDNDYQLHRQMKQPQWANLTRKIAAGKYNRDAAVKLFMYLADEGARRYNKAHGSGRGMGGIFNKPTREIVAKALRDEFEEEFKTSPESFKQWWPKKYAKQAMKLP